MTLFLCSMHCNVEQGLVYFILFKASHLVKAYEKAREIMVSRVICYLLSNIFCKNNKQVIKNFYLL